jgi:hypothetical protein
MVRGAPVEPKGCRAGAVCDGKFPAHAPCRARADSLEQQPKGHRTAERAGGRVPEEERQRADGIPAIE